MSSQRKALIVGIDAYTDKPLEGCVNDANDIASLLQHNADGSPNFAVQLKTSDSHDVTKPELTIWLKECFAGDDDIEVALFYFSGHGAIDENGGYIVTQDYSPSCWGISMEEILKIVNTSNCQNKIVILDCCHSGSVGAIQTFGQKTAVIKEGVTILTASKYDETAGEINGHGIFTELLLEALKGGAADVTGNISPGGVYAFIDRSLGPWGQRPVFKTNVKRFISIRNSLPPIDISIVRKIIDYFEEPTKKFELNPSFEPTNDKNIEHKVIEPLANSKNIEIFKNLQKLESVGLVVPDGAAHMYFAAMESKKCKLTVVGQHYWKLVKEGRL